MIILEKEQAGVAYFNVISGSIYTVVRRELEE